MKNRNRKRYTCSHVGLVCLIYLFISQASMDAQVYVEKQTRHRFAQMTFGADYFGSAGATTNFLTTDGMTQPLNLGNMASPRLIIGGTHFWGHADFAVIFPLSIMEYDLEGQKVNFGTTIETSFKFFPWRIQHHRFAPYVGISLTGYYFQQENTTVENGIGPELVKGVFPLMAGFTFNHNQHLVEAGVSYMTRNENDYYLSEQVNSNLTIAPTFFSLSYRYMLDTTLGAEKSWESGNIEKLTEQFANEGNLNNFYVGIGPSAAFSLGESTYNTEERPFLTDETFNTFLDLSLGYYLHKPDLNFSINYRGYKGDNVAYNVDQQFSRKSIGFEVTKMLGDYHGFVPYVGPIVSMENLEFSETYAGEMVHDLTEQKMAMGLTFGWDIRPNRVQSWLLRTNLRWYPNLNLDVEGEQVISFNALEFNFIQAVYFPGRRKLFPS